MKSKVSVVQVLVVRTSLSPKVPEVKKIFTEESRGSPKVPVRRVIVFPSLLPLPCDRKTGGVDTVHYVVKTG